MNINQNMLFLTDKKDVVKELKAAVKEAKTVYLATDPDREGEAISLASCRFLF